jgi:hypothetical protein
MTCRSCGGPFTPPPTHPGKQYCGERCRAEARRRYKRSYDRAWRQSHPDYMRRYAAAWRGLAV